MPPPRQTNPKALPRYLAPKKLHVALWLLLKLAPGFFPKFLFNPQLLFIQADDHIPPFLHQFWAAFGLFQPWLYDYIYKFAAHDIQAIQPREGMTNFWEQHVTL